MAMATPCLIRFPPPYHNGRAVPAGRSAIDQPLVTAGRTPAHHADRMELVDYLGHGHEGAHRPEGEAPEVHVGTGQDDPDAMRGQVVGDVDNAVVEELGFVDRYD